MSRQTQQRRYRDQPYLDEHLASRSQGRPRSFAGLLRWFLEGFAAETPERLHAAGEWVGDPPRPNRPSDVGITPELVGGSVLGSPRIAEPFRQLLEEAPAQWHRDETGTRYFARPMRAALERLAGHRDGDAPFMAAFLAQVAYSQGDWQSVAARWFPAQPYAWRAFAEHSLRRLEGCYLAEPKPREWRPDPGWVSMSEAQQHAILANEGSAA